MAPPACPSTAPPPTPGHYGMRPRESEAFGTVPLQAPPRPPRGGNDMADIAKARGALLARVLQGDGTASPTERRAAFDNAGLSEPLRTLTDTVARHAYKVTDEHITAARQSGLSDDQ